MSFEEVLLTTKASWWRDHERPPSYQRVESEQRWSSIGYDITEDRMRFVIYNFMDGFKHSQV